MKKSLNNKKHENFLKICLYKAKAVCYIMLKFKERNKWPCET